MASSPLAISVRGVSKSYCISHGLEKYSTLAETILARVRNPLARPRREIFWALRDVSFDVAKGEVVGIIGRNGAGKSTLLKILSRITEPTAGEIDLYGRVGSLLEVGTGFHPELTGRENIFLNGQILGMRRKEITRQFDAIVEFAEVAQFIDTPVKRYSSGMYVRLAFAVAAHLNPELLIVDEVLAVGDASFQKKCLGKMNDVATREGRTVLFVSHNMVAVQSLCKRVIHLAGGHIVDQGQAASVIGGYLSLFNGHDQVRRWDNSEDAPGNELLRVQGVSIVADGSEEQTSLSMQTPVRIDTDYRILKSGAQLHITYHLINDQGAIVLTTGCPAQRREAGVYRGSFVIPGNLLNSGGYCLKLLIVQDGNRVIYENGDLASFTVADTAERDAAWLGREPGVVQPVLEWQVRKLVGDRGHEPIDDRAQATTRNVPVL